MQLANEVNRLSLDLIQPLCDETHKLFRKVNIQPSDRIVLSMTTDLKTFKIRFLSIDGEQRGSGGYDARMRFPTRIPEMTRKSDEIIHAGATDLTAIVIAHHWAPEQIIFDDLLSRETYKYLLATFCAQSYSIRERSETASLSFTDSTNYPLNRYQKVALKACLNREGFGLFMEQGTGKTAVCIARICNEAKVYKARTGKQYTCLVICPKNVRANWLAEMKKFATCSGKVTIIRGAKLERVKCLIDAMRQSPEPEDCYTLVVTSYDSVAMTMDAMCMPEWNLCILDESHYIKNETTRRWKAMRKLRERCAKRMVLTGTPITNTMLDLYTQFEFLGENWSGFSSWSAFRDFFGQYKAVQHGSGEGQNQSSYETLVGMNHVPMLQERLARQCYLIRKKEALPDLPKKMYNLYEVEMTNEQAEVYQQVQYELMAELENDLATAGDSGKGYLVVQNTLVKMLRLAQITSGHVGTSAVMDDLGNEISPATMMRFDPNPKVEALVEILKEKQPDEKALVWASEVQSIRTIAARLAIEGIEAVTYYGATSDKQRELNEWRFNCDPDCKVLIGNPSAGGTGLNLLGYDHSKTYPGMPPTSCNHVIYYSQNWSSTQRSQSEDRAHRKGTMRHVQYTDLVVLDTIDSEIRTRVVEKRMNALKIQDVREIIERALRKAKA